MTDGEVTRLMLQRAGREETFTAELESMNGSVDWLPIDQRSRGRLYVMAQPVSTTPNILPDAFAGKHILDLVLPVVQEFQPIWASGFRYITHEISHPDGLAAANWDPEQWIQGREGDLAFLQVRDNGTISFASGDAVRPYGDGGPLAISLPAVCEAVQQVSLLSGHLATKYFAYTGEWRLGVRLDGLRGLYPSLRYHQSYGGRSFTGYPTGEYSRTATVPLAQLTSTSSAAAQAVLTNLARGLNLDRRVFPYAHPRELERTMRS